MPSNPLLLCPPCQRHVRASTESCPFCSAQLPVATGPVADPRVGVALRSRAQIMGYGVGVGAAAIATALLTSACPAYGCPDPGCGEPPRDAATAVDAGPEDDAGGSVGCRSVD